MQLLSVQRVFQRDVVFLDQFIDGFPCLVGNKTCFQHQQLVHTALDGLLDEMVTVFTGGA